MKNIIITIIILILLFCCSCSDAEYNGSEETLPYSSEYHSIAEWVDYEFTKDIPNPQSGNIQSVSTLHSEKGKKHNIVISDISREESDKYIRQLRDCGYLIIESAANDMSTGICMIKNNIYLSISYSDGIFGMLIDTDADNNNILY